MTTLLQLARSPWLAERLLTALELHVFDHGGPDCGAEGARDVRALLPVGAAIRIGGLKGEPAHDHYGRTLADVYEAYPTSETAEARALQAEARAAGRGVWGLCGGFPR